MKFHATVQHAMLHCQRLAAAGGHHNSRRDIISYCNPEGCDRAAAGLKAGTFPTGNIDWRYCYNTVIKSGVFVLRIYVYMLIT